MAEDKPRTRRVSFEARWTEELPAETAFEKGETFVLNPAVELTVERVHVMRGVTFGADADAVHVELLDTPPRAPTSRGFAALKTVEPGAGDPFADDDDRPTDGLEYGTGHGRVEVRFDVTMTEWLLPKAVPREGDRLRIEGRWFRVHRSFPVTTTHKASAHSVYDVFDHYAVALVQETALSRGRGGGGRSAED